MTDTAQNGKPEIDAETFALGPRKPPQLRVVETPKTRLDFALYFLSKGFLILPVRANEKRAFSKDGGGKPEFATPGHPLNGGTLRATNHAPTIKRWFRDYPDINYGLALLGRTCVDVDVRKGEHWQFELSVVMGFDETPDTLANGSANGGFHIFFEGETENKNKAFKSGADPSCIDIKAGKTAYVVGPGCTVDGKPYRLLRDLPIAPLPDFVRFSGAVDAAPTNMTDTTERETPPPLEVTVSALKYLAEHDKEAICDRGMWLETLAAMKFSYGEAGRDAADDWSETADNFDAEVQDATWDSLKRASGKVKTAASIVWRARQKGWTAIDIEFADIFEAAANENASGASSEQTGKSETQAPPRILVKSATEMTIEGVLEYEKDPLVEGIFLRRGEQATLHAETTAGKTFLGIDLGFHLALPSLTHWHDDEIAVAHVPVLYVALEDVPGFEKQVVAAKKQFGDPGDWFMRVVPDLTLNSTKAGEEGVATIIAASAEQAKRCGVSTGLIIIDTKIRATAGDNDDKTQDAGRYVEQRVGKIIKATGATVLTMAHPNRAGDERGSLVGKQADDVRLTVIRKNGKRTLYVEKVRNGEGERTQFDYTLKLHELGRTAKDKAITSCTLVKSDPSATGKSGEGQQSKPKRGAATLNATFSDLRHEGKCVAELLPVAQVPGLRASAEDVNARFKTLYPGTPATRRQAWKAVKDNLPPGFELSDDGLTLWQADAPFGLDEDGATA